MAQVLVVTLEGISGAVSGVNDLASVEGTLHEPVEQASVMGILAPGSLGHQPLPSGEYRWWKTLYVSSRFAGEDSSKPGKRIGEPDVPATSVPGNRGLQTAMRTQRTAVLRLLIP